MREIDGTNRRRVDRGREGDSHMSKIRSGELNYLGAQHFQKNIQNSSTWCATSEKSRFRHHCKGNYAIYN